MAIGNPLAGGLTLGVYGAARAMPVLVLAMAPSVGRSGTGLVATSRTIDRLAWLAAKLNAMALVVLLLAAIISIVNPAWNAATS
jgi:hypothetical protein